MRICFYRSVVRSPFYGLLLLLVLIFTSVPLIAESQPTGFDPKLIDTFVRQQVERHGLPGLALAVVDGDQIVQLQGYGKADPSGRPITPQTPFILASASKPLTALAVMQLVEAGKVDLDAPVQRSTALRLPTLYLVIDGVLGTLLLLALCSFLRLPRWTKQLQQRQATGQLRLPWVNLHLCWELGFPIVLLAAARLLLHLLGAQSWAEGLLLFPDLGAWLWVFAALLLLTGVLRLINLRHVLHHGGGQLGTNTHSDVDWVDSHAQGDARGLI